MTMHFVSSMNGQASNSILAGNISASATMASWWHAVDGKKLDTVGMPLGIGSRSGLACMCM